jgi:anti-sigma factor RsiW
MSAASRKAMDECLRFSASMAPYVDGELDAGHAVDMEAHVIGCDGCAERIALLRAVRQSMKRTNARCPAALRARIEATIAAEQERAVVSHGPTPDAAPAPNLIRLRHAVGLAAAAGVVFAMGMSRYLQAQAPVGDLALASATATETGIDSLLDTLIALHAHPFQPDTMDQEQLPRFDPLLGVRVTRPAFQPFGARFQGARMHAVSDRGSLLQLQYAMPDGKTADGKHLTMYIFNPHVVSVHASRLQQRMVRQRPILVGRLRGYSVAALEQSGVGYAVASDFDQDESTKMVLAALQQ